MLNKTALILVALLVLQTTAQDNEFVFAFSWLGGFCKSKNGNVCDSDKYDLWDQQSFTIHGLWSQERNSPRIFGDFDLSLISGDRALADKLLNYMPPSSKSGQDEFFLWDHEWSANSDAHGHDYGNVVTELFPEDYKGLSEEERNVKVQKNFFHEIVNFYESYPGARKIAKRTHTKAELAGLFGVQANWIQVSCQSSNYIKELKVCASLSKDKKFTAQPCSKTGTNCKGTSYELWDWKQTTQTRIIQHDTELEAALGFKPTVSLESADVPNLETKKAQAETEDSSSESSAESL